MGQGARPKGWPSRAPSGKLIKSLTFWASVSHLGLQLITAPSPPRRLTAPRSPPSPLSYSTYWQDQGLCFKRALGKMQATYPASPEFPHLIPQLPPSSVSPGPENRGGADAERRRGCTGAHTSLQQTAAPRGGPEAVLLRRVCEAWASWRLPGAGLGFSSWGNTVGFMSAPRRGLLCAPNPGFPQIRPISRSSHAHRLRPPLGAAASPARGSPGPRERWDTVTVAFGPGGSNPRRVNTEPVPTCHRLFPPGGDEQRRFSSKAQVRGTSSIWWGNKEMPS